MTLEEALVELEKVTAERDRLRAIAHAGQRFFSAFYLLHPDVVQDLESRGWRPGFMDAP